LRTAKGKALAHGKGSMAARGGEKNVFRHLERIAAFPRARVAHGGGKQGT